MIKCSQCGKTFETKEGEASVASISGSIMGDEYTESYFFCDHYGVYTVEICRDRFCGDESLSVRGPIPKADGEAKVEMIRQCSKPWNKRGRCEAHRSYFGGWLD